MPALGKLAINLREPAMQSGGEQELFGGVSGKKKLKEKQTRV